MPDRFGKNTQVRGSNATEIRQKASAKTAVFFFGSNTAEKCHKGSEKIPTISSSNTTEKHQKGLVKSPVIFGTNATEKCHKGSEKMAQMRLRYAGTVGITAKFGGSNVTEKCQEGLVKTAVIFGSNAAEKCQKKYLLSVA